MRHFSVRTMVRVAILGAVANVLTMLRFPLPFMPPFMDFDLAGIPSMVALFTMGPAAAVSVVGIKVLLKLLLTGTMSMFTGELQNFILSCAYLLPAWCIYQRSRTRAGALGGMALGTVVCAVVAVFTNMYIIIPFYVRLYGMSMEDIVTMTQAVNRFVDSEWKFIALGVIPFNIIKGGVTSAMIYAAYPTLMRIAGREGLHAVS